MLQPYKLIDILGAWDSLRTMHRFPVLDGGKADHAAVRLTLYRDDHRWASVFEELIFFSASPGHSGIMDVLTYAGNCIIPSSDGITEKVRVTSDGTDGPTFLLPFDLDVNPAITTIRCRDKVVPVDLSFDRLRARGIPIKEGDAVEGQHLLWSLLPENRTLLLATEEEKRQRLPGDLPQFLQLDEWHHPLLMTERSKPSDSPTFQMLADALATGDLGRYAPKLPPNTHWRNWVDFEHV